MPGPCHAADCNLQAALPAVGMPPLTLPLPAALLCPLLVQGHARQDLPRRNVCQGGSRHPGLLAGQDTGGWPRKLTLGWEGTVED